MSMDSMDFGLSESNMSYANFAAQRLKQDRSSTEKLPTASKVIVQDVTVEKEDEEDYSNDFD